MPPELVPFEIIEEVLEDTGNALDKRFGMKKWLKPLYWTTVVAVFFGIAAYYFS